jgi:hypothetical protein
VVWDVWDIFVPRVYNKQTHTHTHTRPHFTLSLSPALGHQLTNKKIGTTFSIDTTLSQTTRSLQTYTNRNEKEKTIDLSRGKQNLRQVARTVYEQSYTNNEPHKQSLQLLTGFSVSLTYTLMNASHFI